jgi:hypothetical protein
MERSVQGQPFPSLAFCRRISYRSITVIIRLFHTDYARSMGTPRRSLNIAINVRCQYYGQTIEKHECFRTNEFSEAGLRTEA